jgi:predicted SAM-dependent methyltransferase
MSLFLSKLPFLVNILKGVKLLEKKQIEFISFAAGNDIKYADATKNIPEPDHSVEALYSSHMIEHLDCEEVKLFLKEARRILRHDGIIRISVPDIRLLVERYIKTGNANSLIEATKLTHKRPKTLLDKIRYLVTGERLHHWMYDGESLRSLLSSAGFINPQIMKKGETNISDPGKLDLSERSEESVYVEAKNP